ncbi:MAG: type II toxin-antitoxin system VapC family toxin [Coriobacteriales bacterium]|jgi:predicted nucleic acid-binding protein
MRLFIDTNVLFDIFAQREPFVESAKRLLVMQAFGDAELWSAPQSFLDIFYVLRKFASPNVVQERLARSTERINICTTGHADILAAMNLQWHDLEDATIAICCKKTGADFLITRDVEGFKQLSIPALSPEDFFTMLNKKHGITYDIGDF